MVEVFLYGILAWIALLILVIGVLTRVVQWVKPGNITSLASVSVISYNWPLLKRAGEVIKRILTFYTLRYSDKALFVGAFLFHWGIFLTLFLGHTALFFTPEQLQTMGLPPEARHQVAFYLGIIFSILALAGLIILWWRRLARREVRTISYLDDWFALTLVTLIVVIGLINTVVIKPHYDETVTPWLLNLLRGDVASAVAHLAEEHVMVKLHILLAEILMIYVPLGKLIHPFATFFEPTITMPPYKVKGSEESALL